MASTTIRKRRPVSDREAMNYNTENDEDKAKREQEEALKKLSDPVELMNHMRTSGGDARLTHKTNWDINWDLYNNNYDWSLKADWQSKNYIALIPRIVRGIKFVIKRSMVNAGDFFDVDFPAIPKSSQFKDQANVWGRSIIRHFLDQNKFPSLVSEAVVMSLLESLMILKVLPAGDTGVTITADSAYNIILDPTGRNRWKIHQIPTDYDLVLEKAEQGIYDLEEVKKAAEDFTRQPGASDDAIRKVQQTTPTITPPDRKSCVVDEFFGDLIGGDGKIIMKMCSFSVLNEKYLIRKPFPIKDKLEHGQIPIIVSAINPKPKSVYHQALVSDVSGLAHVATELLNITLDSNLMSMAKAAEVDLGMVADATDIQKGLYPGKMYKKKKGYEGKRMIDTIDIGGPTQQDLMLFENVKRTVQEDMGFYNEFSQGTLGQTPGGRATAREVSERSSTSSASLQSLSEEIEEQSIVPLLQQLWSNLCQYFRDFDQLDGILPKEIIDFLHVNQKDGLKAIFGDAAKFTAKGMSGVLNREVELSKLKDCLQLVGAFPQVMPLLKGENILASAIMLYGFDRQKWMLSDEEIQTMKNNATTPPGTVPPAGPGGQLPPGGQMQ